MSVRIAARVAFSVALAVLGLQPAPQSLALHASADSGPRGIYIFPTPASVQNGLYERAMAVHGVDGVAVVFDWSDLSPAGKPKVYDFTELDRRIALARAHQLAVELVIEAGKGIPEWMFTPAPAGLAAKRLAFVYSHHDGAGQPRPAVMPPPWDTIYQDAFGDMLQQVAAHLRGTGEIRDVSVVKLTGMNTLSEELRLPAQTAAETGRQETADSLAVWQRAGYRPKLVEAAFDGLTASFARAFPGMMIALPIIMTNGFPPIDDHGQIVRGRAAKALQDDLLETLLRHAAKAFPDHFVLQHDFLIADEPARPQAVALARSNRLPLAWQTNLLLGQSAAASGTFGNATPCNEESFLRLLRNGIHPQGGTGPSERARYIEVFPPDAIAFPTAIATAHAELTR